MTAISITKASIGKPPLHYNETQATYLRGIASNHGFIPSAVVCHRAHMERIERRVSTFAPHAPYVRSMVACAWSVDALPRRQ
jgi:hypothetical protein